MTTTKPKSKKPRDEVPSTQEATIKPDLTVSNAEEDWTVVIDHKKNRESY